MSPPAQPFHIRLAIFEDIPALNDLIQLSVRTLQCEDYSMAQREGALVAIFAVDTHLITDGTYFVAEAVSEGGKKSIVGCGGWSKRKTLFGGDRAPDREDTFLDPQRESAKIRAFFVHPAWVRQGVGSKLLELCETGALEAGFKGFEMGATLTGVRLFSAKGYQVIDRIEVPLPNGASLPVVRMWRSA